MYPREAGPTDQHTGNDLADDGWRSERMSGGHQRPEQPGDHQQDERAERHRAFDRSLIRLTVSDSPVDDDAGSTLASRSRQHTP